jgi:uncharacterized protein (DUF2252 family)
VEVPGGRDPLAILEAQSRTRLPALVPLRWTRMAASPFSFFRGAAGVMAADLAGSPGTGIDVQACGDAHLLNFGLYASPERTLMFDLNDFDETLRAPWEWDVKRLAASTVIAGRSAGLPSAATSLAAAEAIRRYGRTMARLATMSVLDAWSVSIDAAAAARSRTLRRATVRASRRATTRDHVHAFSKLTEVVDGQPRIRAHPPLVLRIEQILSAEELAYIDKVIEEHHRGYLETLRPDHRLLMERYRLVDFALKVVGTGSVGTRCYVALLVGANGHPLLMQGKEAQPSVLEQHVEHSHEGHQGERVVMGQRILQSTSDALLGWGTGLEGRHFYWRQLWDNKGAYDPEAMNATELAEYAGLCGMCLAQAHARSGDAATISGYIGASPRFSQAIACFAEAYADQNEQDHRALLDAVSSGRIETTPPAR